MAEGMSTKGIVDNQWITLPGSWEVVDQLATLAKQFFWCTSVDLFVHIVNPRPTLQT